MTNIGLCEVAHLGHRHQSARHGSGAWATGRLETHVSILRLLTSPPSNPRDLDNGAPRRSGSVSCSPEVASQRHKACTHCYRNECRQRPRRGGWPRSIRRWRCRIRLCGSLCCSQYLGSCFRGSVFLELHRALGGFFLILHGPLGRGRAAVLRVAACLDTKIGANQSPDYPEKRTQRRGNVGSILRIEHVKESKQPHNKYEGAGYAQNSGPD